MSPAETLRLLRVPSRWRVPLAAGIVLLLLFCTDAANWTAKRKHQGGVAPWLLDHDLSVLSLSYWIQPWAFAVPDLAEGERIDRWVASVIQEDQVRSAEQQRCNPSPSYQLLSEKVGCQLTSPRQCRLPKLAYVVPYAKHEVEQVLLLLRMWQLASYQPCQQCVNADLILAGANQQAVATLVEARGRDKTSPYCIGRSCTGPSQGHCWRDIFDLDLQLPDKYDRYGAGPPNMFRMLFSSDVMGRRGYTAMFWGEPDTFPVRAGWLDGLFRKAIDMHHGPWWELGTVQSFVRRNQNNADRFLWHTNGNALYRYDSPAFAEFVSQAIPEGMEGAFDTSLYEHRFGESKWGLSRKLPLLAHTNIHLLHRFGYTEAVKNHPQDLCMPNLKNWTERWPGVFLVHSKAFGALLKCSRCCETSSDGFFRATKLATGVLSAGMRCLYESHEEPHHGPTQLC